MWGYLNTKLQNKPLPLELYCNVRQCPDEEHLYWTSQWNNKTTTKGRLQPQTKTMKNTCSVLFSGNRIADSSTHSIYGRSTCTATREYLVTQGKWEVGRSYTPLITTLVILFPLKLFKHLISFLLQIFNSTLNSTSRCLSLSLAPISCNNTTQSYLLIS